MIRLTAHVTSNITIWKSATFTWPSLSGSSGATVYLNHNQNSVPEDFSVILYNPGGAGNGKVIMPTFERSGTSLYFYSQGGGDDNTLDLHLKRAWESAARDCYAVLKFYGD